MRARDRDGGEEFDIRAQLVLNAAGPWADYLLEDPDHFGGHRRGHFSRDACFLVNRKPQSPYALAVPGLAKDSDAVVSRSARHLFAVPWRDCTLIGVWHRLFSDRPDTARVEESEIAAWMVAIICSGLRHSPMMMSVGWRRIAPAMKSSKLFTLRGISLCEMVLVTLSTRSSRIAICSTR